MCNTYRFHGHHAGDPLNYREKEEVERWRQQDPVERVKRAAIDSGVLSEAGIVELERRIEAQIEARVSERIGVLEKTLAEQSSSIGALRDRAVETDANLQRLIVAIEKLCERSAPAPQAEQSSAAVPFETRRADAPQREPESKRSRFSMTRIFALIGAIALPFFSR